MAEDAQGWQRSDRALPPDTTQAVLVWLAEVQPLRGHGAAVATTTGSELRQIIETEGRRYWWHPWVPPVAQLALRPPGVPASLAAAWMRPGD